MCGIAAVLLTPKSRSPAQWQAIWQHFTDNLHVNEARGRDATGVAITDRQGRITLQKQAIAATRFTQTTDYAALTAHLSDQTVLLLGHTRLPTQGDPTNAQNNHPLLVGHTLGIHNGHIDNSDEIFQQRQLPRIAEVDSEVIFRLLDLPSHRSQNLAGIAADLRSLKGRFTFLAIQQRQPTQLLIVKHHNPLSLHYHREWEALLFSSSYLFLRKGFGPDVLHEQVPKDEVLVFDALHLDRAQARPLAQCPL